MRVLFRSVPLLLLVIALAAACGGGGDDATPPPSGAGATPPPPPAPPSAAACPVDRCVTVANEDIGGTGEYNFNPSELSFNVGETVELTLGAETEFHTFTVEDLGIDEALGAEEVHPFTFTFDRAGTFKLICLAHPQMTGTITVR